MNHLLQIEVKKLRRRIADAVYKTASVEILVAVARLLNVRLD